MTGPPGGREAITLLISNTKEANKQASQQATPLIHKLNLVENVLSTILQKFKDRIEVAVRAAASGPV